MEIHSNQATTNAVAKCIINDVSETSLSLLTENALENKRHQ
jgi:hypothetical protein